MLPPGATIGILGGGPLGRMLAMAAAELGFRTRIFAPEADSPGFEVAAETLCAPYDDAEALARFARGLAVATLEFENVPVATLEALARLCPVAPGARALAVTQDRVAEKAFMNGAGLPTAAYAEVSSEAELVAALQRIGAPAILKTRRFGYDGKGQVRLTDPSDAPAAFAAIGRAPAILEGFVAFRREVSVVAARAEDGRFAAFPAAENTHRNGILDRSIVPAAIRPETAASAVAATKRIAEGLGYVGVLAVEFFIVGDGADERIIGNEIAPRVHNSGHWSLDGAVTSQFEQHIRAIAGWPLGDASAQGPAEMINLVGEGIARWAELAAEPRTKLHIYGKTETRPGRKMGHATRLGPAGA